ncbi:unnamed protein product [Taenia asiatica]|uniref:SRF-dependent transcription regulation-associated protein n=1 Tax=Taenia asiatica TaxID=60517 RepID=A0A0R3VUL3_TAEAS|nr:unnamed protein product [Taenia asiatica]
MPLTYGIDDENEELSIDVVQLNNIVLALRPLVKKARVLVIRELASCVKRQKLKQAKAPEGKRKRLGRKIINKLAEIRLLKKMNDVKLCKLALANVNPHKSLEEGGKGLSKQDRIIIRLVARPEIAEFVSNFRTKHTDWPTLVQYLLYKNTSGKWKTPEQKRKVNKRRKGDLPFPLVDQKDIVDNQTASSIQQFKAYKEKSDRELIAAQRRLLREEAEEEEDRKLEGEEDSKSETAHNVRYDNPEMKAFISELIAKMDSGENIDEYLVPSDGDRDSKLPAEPTKTGFREGSELQTNEAIGLAATTKSRGREKVKKLGKQPKKAVEVSKSVSRFRNFLYSCLIKVGEKETPEPCDSSRKQANKAKDNKVVTFSANSKVDADGTIHEIIVEEVAEDSFDQEDAENILGQDDVEMKKEIRERRTKSEGDAAHGRVAHQQQVRNFRRGRGGLNNRRGPPRKRPAADTTEAPLHPSWAAKREQRALLSLSTKAPRGGTRIVFDDE